MPRRIFDDGLTRSRPKPEDILKLGSDLAIARGLKQGLEVKALRQVDEALGGARALADSLAEKIDNAIGDPIADAKMMAEAIMEKIKGHITLHMAPAVELAFRLGMDATDLPSVQIHVKKRTRTKRRGKGPQADAMPGPQDDPPLPQDDPPGDPPQGFMQGPPGGVFPPGQFGQTASPMSIAPPSPPLPPAPNLSTVPPDYTILVQAGTCRTVAIPGTPSDDYLAAGYVPVATAGQLQAVPPGMVNAVWGQIVAAVGGCNPPPSPGAPGSGRQAGPPGGAFPPGQFPPQAGRMGGAANVQGGQLAGPIPSGPTGQPAGGTLPPAGSAGNVQLVPGMSVGIVGPMTGTSGGEVPIAVDDAIAGGGMMPMPGQPSGSTMPIPPRAIPPRNAPLAPPSPPPGLMQPFPPSQPPSGLSPIQWIPGPDGSLLPIFPSQPSLPPGGMSFPLGEIPPRVGLLPIMGGGPQPPQGGFMPMPPRNAPLAPPSPPPGLMQPFPPFGPPSGLMPLPSGPQGIGGFPLPGPGVPPVPPGLVSQSPIAFPAPPLTGTAPPQPPIFVFPPPMLPAAPQPPAGSVPTAGGGGSSPPPCPPPNIYLTCPQCNCPVEVPPPEFQPIPSPPPSLIQPTGGPKKPAPQPPPSGCPTPTKPEPPCDFGSITDAYPKWVADKLAAGQASEDILAEAERCGLCVKLIPAPGEGGPVAPGPVLLPPACPILPGPTNADLQPLASCLSQGTSAVNDLLNRIQQAFKLWCADAPGSLPDLIDKWSKQVAGISFIGGPLSAILYGVKETVQCGSCNAVVIEQWLSYLLGCPSAPVGGMMILETLVGIWDRWIGKVPEKFHAAAMHIENYACPTNPPTTDAATAAWLAGGITDEMWTCVARVNGDRPDLHQMIRDSQRDKPTLLDAISLKRRGEINDTVYSDLARRNGVTTDLDLELFETATEWVPSPTDAIEWMLKDVDDPQIQQTFNLGAEFQLKYQGQTKYAFDANGMSEAMANTKWRSHWRNMAPTTLYEMHKRLRPGWTKLYSDQDVVALALAILPRKPVGPGAAQEMAANPRTWLEDLTLLPADAQPQAARDYLESLQTTGFHLFEALGQADYPPFWRDRLMAISYNVLTRVDMRRAYETNQMDTQTLVARLQDRGYTPNDAAMLGGFYREAAVQLSARRPAANQWVSVGYDATLLRQTLIDNGMRPDMWPDVFRRLQVRRKIYIQTKCLTVWKKEFVQKLWTETEMYQRLLGMGLVHEQAQQLLQDWQCERTATHRQVMAASLCKQRRQGIINDVALINGLKDLGFRRRDINRMVESCLKGTPPAILSVPRTNPSAVPPREGQ